MENIAGSGTNEGRGQVAKQNAEQKRQLQTLKLQRENILSQRTSSPARRSALASALAEVEAQIQALE